MSEQNADLAIIRQVQQGNKQAYNLLVTKYQYKVVSIAQKYVSCPSDAQDIAQEAFIKAYQALPSFRGESAFYTWLYRITINTAMNFVSSNMKKNSFVDVNTPDIESYEGAEKLHLIDNPENILESIDAKKAIMNTLHSLPDDLRLAIIYREIEEMSYEQIAEKMNCPIGTVRSRIFRAREIIEKALADLETI
jgi:RNA polymerase sigma-70 factor (ECF subfamily)